MTDQREGSNLLDLIRTHHFQLQKSLEDHWKTISDIYLSNSEWSILTNIYQEGQTTISYITRQVAISRQATHKSIRQLRKKGLVLVKDMTTNKRQKLVQLTSLGKECYEINESLKEKLEDKLANQIGFDQVQQLKDILQSKSHIDLSM